MEKAKVQKGIPDIGPVERQTPPKIAVHQYDLKGKYIQTFESEYAAGKTLKISAEGISECIRKKAKSAGGFQWRKAE